MVTSGGNVMSEPFDWKKLLTSPFTGLYWVKVTMMGLGICMIGFVLYGMYKAYIKKPLPNTTQNADKIENYYYEPRHWGFGCATVKISDRKEVNTNALRKEEER
jgi:hypothetical protein